MSLIIEPALQGIPNLPARAPTEEGSNGQPPANRIPLLSSGTPQLQMTTQRRLLAARWHHPNYDLNRPAIGEDCSPGRSPSSSANERRCPGATGTTMKEA